MMDGFVHEHDVDMRETSTSNSASTSTDRRSPQLLTAPTTYGSGPQPGDTRIVAIVYGPGQAHIVSVFAEVLGKSHRMIEAFRDVHAGVDQGLVVGIQAATASADIAQRDAGLVVAINAHCVNLGMPPDGYLSAQCDYEFLYTEAPFFRRDLCRFISFTLGQLNHHETLMAKPRTYIISTTFPDVRAALPNIDILTVGADAVEIRVDLLQEPLPDGTFSSVPSLSYVGEQVMLLRQKTELPIIFTTRCTRENGRFPMDDPDLYYEYLYRAIQWGVEYVDVELWLPEAIRESLWRRRGSSRIMSAFHDFSGTFKWPSRRAEEVFVESRKYADIIKMITIINDYNENFELEYFRSKMRADYPDAPPFSAVNMGETGQFSRTLNKVFTPITHPLLPIIAAPGQMSAAEINQALALLGQLPKKSFYGIISSSSNSSSLASSSSSSSSRNTGPTTRPQAPPFYEKCFNELGLPHHFAVVVGGCLETWCNQKNFGGAYLHPPVSHAALVANSAAFFASANGGAGPILSEAARAIGVIDTIVVRPGSGAASSTSAPASAPASIPSSPRRSSSHAHGHARIGSSSGSHHDHYHHRITTPPTSGGGFLPPNTTLVLDNLAWRGALSTLTRDLAPSAYAGRAAVVLASAADDAAAALFALRVLRVGKIYTVGFKTPVALLQQQQARRGEQGEQEEGTIIEPFNSLESLQRARMVGATDDAAGPFVVVSALGAEKNKIAAWVIRAFGAGAGGSGSGSGSGNPARKVFLDLADGGGSSAAAIGGVGGRQQQQQQQQGDLPLSVVAEQSGFAAYGAADTAAFTTVETLRKLVGQNVPYSFVRLASGNGIY